MRVTTLGTGSPIPVPDRAGPATLVQAGGQNLLFDCGRGVLLRLSAVGIIPPALDNVFLTHLHSDHITDFNDVVTTRWVMSPLPNPLPVTGPPGTADFARRTIAMLADDVGWRLAHHEDLTWEPSYEVVEILDGVAFSSAGLRVLAAPTDHRPVTPSVGYRVEHDECSVVVRGDGVPCDGLDRLCAGADLYVQTAMRADIVRAIPSPRLQDVITYHSSCADAGRTAARGGVRTLVLTHPVPVVAAGTDDDWVAEAAAHFDGEIHLATDLASYDV